MTDEPTNDNVVRFTGWTKLDISPDAVLTSAVGKLEDVVIIGTTLDGNEYFASSSGDSKNLLWHLETAKHMLMTSIFSTDEDDYDD